MTAIATRMSLDDFLSLPETEPPSEFICGEVVQKPMPTYDHGTIVAELTAALHQYLRRTGEGKVVVELRHADRTEARSYLPDLSVVTSSHTPTGRERTRGPFETPPDLAVEVLSPDDRAGRVSE